MTARSTSNGLQQLFSSQACYLARFMLALTSNSKDGIVRQEEAAAEAAGSSWQVDCKSNLPEHLLSSGAFLKVLTLTLNATASAEAIEKRSRQAEPVRDSAMGCGLAQPQKKCLCVHSKGFRNPRGQRSYLALTPYPGSG